MDSNGKYLLHLREWIKCFLFFLPWLTFFLTNEKECLVPGKWRGPFFQNLQGFLSSPRSSSASFVIQITGWEAANLVGFWASTINPFGCFEWS